MKSQYFGIPLPALFALIAATFSGVNIFLTKVAVTALKDPILYTGVKNGIVAILLLSILLLLSRQQELKKLSRNQWFTLGAIGLIGGSVPFALFFTGLSMTTAVSASLIQKTLVLWIALFAYPFLKERFSPLLAVGVTLIFLGNIFLGGVKTFTFSTGEYLILAATILWAIENIIAKKVLAHVSALTVVSARMIFGSLLLFAFLIATHRIAPVTALSGAQWGWTILTATILLGYVISWYTALSKAPAMVVAVLLLPATLITSVLSAIFVTHPLTGTQVLAGTAVIFGVILITLQLRKSIHPPLSTQSESLIPTNS